MSTELTPTQKIENLLAQVAELYSQCETIAKENDVSFTTNGPIYGMGGSFYPNHKNEYIDSYWHASSHSC